MAMDNLETQAYDADIVAMELQSCSRVVTAEVSCLNWGHMLHVRVMQRLS